jgi:hypothetical protein
MPLSRSDMTVNTFSGSVFSDNSSPRMYLVGGCIADQYCVYLNGVRNCDACSEITNKINYFTPDDKKWHTNCTDAPTKRFRHMSKNYYTLIIYIYF